MPDYQAARIRVSIDTDIDTRERFNKAVPQGIRGQLLTEVLRQLTEVAEKPEGLHHIIDIINGKITLCKSSPKFSADEIEHIMSKPKYQTSQEPI
jgi:hypothetical protein